MRKRTEWIGNLPENNYITCLTFEYSDWNIATSKWHLGEEVAWLSVINNSQEERGGENGLHYSYVVGSAHPEGTFLKKTRNSISRCFYLFVSSFSQKITRKLPLEGTNTESSFEWKKFMMANFPPCLRKITNIK